MCTPVCPRIRSADERAVSLETPPPAEPRHADRVRMRLFLDAGTRLDAETRAQLERLAALPGVAHPIAVLPDLHRKGGSPSPTGICLAAAGRLVPPAVDTGICCGLRVVTTGLEARGF